MIIHSTKHNSKRAYGKLGRQKQEEPMECAKLINIRDD